MPAYGLNLGRDSPDRMPIVRQGERKAGRWVLGPGSPGRRDRQPQTAMGSADGQGYPHPMPTDRRSGNHGHTASGRCDGTSRHKKGATSRQPLTYSPPKKAKRGPGGPLEGSRCPAPVAGRRRPALPPAGPAVPSALGGLTSGFGMGPGVPPLPWPPTGDGRGEGGSPPPPQGRTATRSARLAPSRVRMGGKSSAY